MTVNVATPGPHIDSITPSSALPAEEITIIGRNFDSYLASNNMVTFRGSDISIAATHVSPDGTMLAVYVPADKEPGDCMVSVTTSHGTSNEVPFTVQTFYDGVDRVLSQLTDKMADLPEGHPAVDHIIVALDLLGEIKDLLSTPNPDAAAIMFKTQDTMGHIWDAIQAGADTLWDKPYLITAMRATLAKSMIGVEQSYMIYDLMKTIGPNHTSWPYLRSASDAMHVVVSEYMFGSMSRAITAMKSVVSALQSAKIIAGGIDTTAIQLSLAQSPIHFLSKLKETLENAGTEFLDEAEIIGTAISTATEQALTGIYDGALDTLAGLWDHLGSMLGTMCYCVPRFTGEKSGEAMKVAIKYQLYYDNCNGWHIQFAARGNDGAQEVFDTDEIEVKCAGRYIFWSLTEQSIECVSVKPVIVADTVSVVGDQWTFKQDANNPPAPGYLAGVLTSNKRTIADYKVPKLAGDAKSNTDQLTITLQDGRNQANDNYTNTVTVLIRRPMNFCNEDDLNDPFNAEGYIFEYADEFSRYRVWLDIPQVNRADDLVIEKEGCGCEMTPAWAVGATMSTQQAAVVPEYFAVSVPQTFTIGDNTDTDELTVSCPDGYMCLSGKAVKTLPDAIRYAWNLMTGTGKFDYGINSSETSFTASTPSTQEKDFLFIIPTGNTGFEFNETDAAIGKEGTAVLVDLIADGINEYDEVYKGAFVIVNDNDTNEDGEYDWNQKKVVGIKLDPNNPEKTPDEIDLVPFTMDVRPLIVKAGNYVKLEIILPQVDPKSETKIWEKPTKEKEFTQYLGQEWQIVQVGANVEMQYLGDDGNWHKVPDVLYIEGMKAGRTARDTRLKLTYLISGNVFCDTVFLNIMDAEIDAPDVNDDNEESTGGYIKFNNDDDDNNGVIDWNDGAMAVEDDDLMEYTMEYLPYLHGGVVRLEIMSGGKDILNPGRIKVWSDRKKTQLILPDAGNNGSLFKEWNTCVDEEIPSVVYVEGCDISAVARDSALRITYSAKQKYGEQIGKECEDIVRTTVLLIDADVDSDNDNGTATPDLDDAEEFMEEDAPGKVLAVSTEEMAPLVLSRIVTTDVPKSRQKFILSKGGAGKIKMSRQINKDEWVTLLAPDKTETANLWDDISKGNMILLVEGVEPGEFELKLTQTATGLFDMAAGTVTTIDLDVDSDNTSGLFGPPDRNATEEQIENDPTLPGKILSAAANDSDADGIPDFADGFDWDGIPGTQDDQSTHKLTPLVLEIAEPIDLSKAKVRFTYSGSDPSGVTLPGGIYTPALGNIRLWKDTGGAVRTIGDYVSTDQYIANALGFTAGKRVVTFYVEGIASGQAGILADVDINGNATMISDDAVLVSVIEVDIDIDSDNDNGSGEPDKDFAEELIEELSPGKVIVLNNDDDDNNQKEDNLDNKVNGVDDQKDMAQIVLHNMGNIPGKQEITITKTDGIRLFNAQTKAEYMKPAETTKIVSWADITANDIVFLVEGVKNGEFELTMTHTASGMSDKIKGTTGKINILGYRPGTMAAPGLGVTEQEEDDSGNLIVMVNDDNDDNDPNGQKDNRDAVIGANDNDIVKSVLLNYFPAGMGQGAIELQISRPDVIKIFKSDGQALLQDYSVDLTAPAGDLSGLVQADKRVEIYMEAVLPEGVLPLEDVVLTLSYKDNTGRVVSSDELHIMIISVDLDIDSDNDDGLNAPKMNDAEDNIENDPTLPGKIIAVALGDSDGDGVPDYADGFNLDQKKGTEEQRRDDASTHRFTPLRLKVPAFVNVKDAEIRFLYDVSPPAEVSRNIISGQYVYTPYAGSLRIWTKDGDKNRNTEPVNKKDGNMVYSNAPYKLSDFGWDAAKDYIELFVEGIATSAVIGDKTIEVKLYPKGSANWTTGSMDLVTATIINVDLDVDTNNDGNFSDFEEAIEEIPGGAVILNDDNDNVNVYPDPAPAGHRPFEPVWDMDETVLSLEENDMVHLKLNAYPGELGGDAVLRIVSGANNIRIWPRVSKGPAGDEIVIPAGGMNYAINTLPQDIYIEGIQTGRTEIGLSYVIPGLNINDTVVINVMSLVEQQAGQRLVINRYNTAITFEVAGGTNDYEYKWDFNGDGDRASDQFERGVNDRIRDISYGPAQTPIRVFLPRDEAHHRQTYDVSVEVTGGLVLHRNIRVALDRYVGNLLAEVTALQRDNKVMATFAWTNTNPVVFDMTDIPGNRTQASFDAQYNILRIINNDNRIQYSAGIDGNGLTPRPGVGANRRVYLVMLGENIWQTNQTLADMSATTNHERIHCLQHVMVRDNNPLNNVWRLLDNEFLGANGYTDFREAEAHLSELTDEDVGWFHAISESQGDLMNFRNRYSNARNNVPFLTPGITQLSGREFLQQLYREIPFEEMKKNGYDASVQAPD